MANSGGICKTFKSELLKGIHAFDVTVARANTNKDVFNLALYTPSGSISTDTTVYIASNEVSSANYTAKGTAVTNPDGRVGLTGGTAFWTPSAQVSWSNVSFTTNCALLFNFTQGEKAVASYTFSDQTVNSGSFALTMPTHDSSTGLLRLT